MSSGWQRFKTLFIGGLTMVGFGQNSNSLLVVSSAGRGLFDVASGDRLSRDTDDSLDWLDLANLRCRGIGSLAGEWIPVAGLWGGGLALGPFKDCPWTIEMTYEPGEIAVCEATGSQYGKRWSIPDFNLDSTYRAVGFAPTGQALVAATSSDVTIYHSVG